MNHIEFRQREEKRQWDDIRQEEDDLRRLQEISKRKELQDRMDLANGRFALRARGINSLGDYLIFVMETVQHYLNAYSSRHRGEGIYDVYNWRAQHGQDKTRMEIVLDKMWPLQQDLANAILQKDGFAVVAILAWCNHIEHCGGSLLVDHGKVEYSAINAISEFGLDAVFGDNAVSRLVSIIENGI